MPLCFPKLGRSIAILNQMALGPGVCIERYPQSARIEMSARLAQRYSTEMFVRLKI
jgi:hypothetical protein